MADNVKPTYATSDVKSGLENEAYLDKVLDGQPTRKDVDAIDKENKPKNAPGSVMIRN
jgi:hypothetical protein